MRPSQSRVRLRFRIVRLHSQAEQQSSLKSEWQKQEEFSYSPQGLLAGLWILCAVSGVTIFRKSTLCNADLGRRPSYGEVSFFNVQWCWSIVVGQFEFYGSATSP